MTERIRSMPLSFLLLLSVTRSFAQDPAGTDTTPAKAAKKESRAGKPSTDKDGLPPYTGPKKRVAVIDLEVKVQGVSTSIPTPSGKLEIATIDIPVLSEFGTGLADMLTTSLVATNRFIVLDRRNLEDVLKEQQLGAAGGVEPASAAKAGKLLGAQVLVRGAVTEFACKKSGTGAGGFLGKILDFGSGKSESTIAIDLRLVDATTGQIIDSVRAEGAAKSSGSSISIARGDIRLGGSKFDSSPLGAAVRDAVQKATRNICLRMDSLPWEARVAEVVAEDEKTAVYINAGSKAGLKAGDVVEISHPGTEIKDPETLVVIGRTRDKLCGRCRIESVTAGIAIAVPIDGAGFQKEDIVRFITPASPDKQQEAHK